MSSRVTPNNAFIVNPVKPPVCGLCGESITGRYIEALNTDWHPNHFLCGGCELPIGEDGFVEADNVAYHRECHVDMFAQRCFYCGQPMVGKYVQDAWGNEFCPFHIEELKRCVLCGRLVDGTRITGHTAESGLQCNVCCQTAVDTPVTAAPLYEEVIRWATSLSLIFPAVPLQLTDLQTLISYESEPKGGRRLGSTRVSTTVCAGVKVKVDVECIAILRGLPQVLFCAVAAHEVGHAWLRAMNIDELKPIEEEGFCELLAYSWLQEELTLDREFYAGQIANNDDVVYGDGFRHLRALSDVYQLPGLIDSLRRTKSLSFCNGSS